MIFDKTQVIELVKNGLDTKERGNTAKIELAMSACLDDMASRLASIASVNKDTKTIAIGDREVTLSGLSNDLRFIYFLRYVVSGESHILTYKAPEEFMNYYDAEDAVAGTPQYYTVLESSSGKPIVRFDVPADTAATMYVFYFADMTPENISKFRSAAAIAHGTLAYFFGPTTEKGVIAYGTYERLVKLSKASDSFVAKPVSEAHFQTNEVTMSAMDIAAGMKYD